MTIKARLPTKAAGAMFSNRVVLRSVVFGLTLVTVTPVPLLGQSESPGVLEKGISPGTSAVTVGVREAPASRVLDIAPFLRAEQMRSLRQIDRRSSPKAKRAEIPARTGAATLLVVNSAYDDPDNNFGNGDCFTGWIATGGIPECTLRSAIQEANNTPGDEPVFIDFDFITAPPPSGYDAANDVWTIPVNTAIRGSAAGVLPPITRANVHINGEIQPAATGFYPAHCGDLVLGTHHTLKVVVDGQLLSGMNDDGIVLSSTAKNSSLRGLVINNFPRRGIDSDASFATLECMYVGTDFAGSNAQPNGLSGILVTDTASVVKNNVISGNLGAGIEVVSAVEPVIDGNLVGVDATGSISLGNGVDGISVSLSEGVRIGGTDPSNRNVISGNASRGIGVNSTTRQLVVEGNHIGTNLAGDDSLANYLSGINDFANETRIGGMNPGAGNLISGNLQNGLGLYGRHTVVEGNLIGTDASGLVAIPNLRDGVHVESDSSRIGGLEPGARNIISGNGDDGVELADTANVVLNNFIGTDISGTTAIPNNWGVFVQGSRNAVGVPEPDAGNVISGNLTSGILVQSLSGGPAEGTGIFGNRIGTNAAGTAAVPNGSYGIHEFDLGAIIGAPGDAGLNVISGNGVDGIKVESTAAFTEIIGNLIGTNATGLAAVANTSAGISVDGWKVTIGGTAGSPEGNVISGNGVDGVYAESTAWHTRIFGNFIGVDRGGNFAIPNVNGISMGADSSTIGGAGLGNLVSGNSAWGIYVLPSAGSLLIVGNLIGTDASGNRSIPNSGGLLTYGNYVTIGGVGDGWSNVVSGNSDYGIGLGSIATNTYIINNFIGTTISGAGPMPNGEYGIVGGGGTALIGGTGLGDGNLIAYHTKHGIHLNTVPSSIRILGNSIHSNGMLGIDLLGGVGTELPSGVNPNDYQDPDTGPNGSQNYPIISSPTTNAGGPTTPISLTLNSLPNTTFRIEIFSNSSVDTSGYGEGQRFVTSTTLSTNGDGDGAYAGSLPTTLAPVGSWITATATRMLGSNPVETSEFSAAVQIAGPHVNLTGKVFLEGSYSGSGMTTPLSFHNVLPTTQPYNLPFYDGTLMDHDGVDVADSIGSNIIDWVVVSLRTTANPIDEKGRRAAFLRNDGYLVGLDGTAPLTIYGVASLDYHVVVCHRNHLCAMSPLLNFNTGSASYDFTANPGYTTGPAAQKVLDPGPPMVYGLFAGDINIDGQITASDFNAWLVSTKAVETGYLAPDCNLDAQSTASDFNLWLVNTKAVATSQVP